MIDLHCHILPGVDDGAKTMEETIEMAKVAVEEGITHILATPHHMNRDWINEKKDVIKLIETVQKELDSRMIPLTIFPGQEVRLYGEVLDDVKDDKILFVDEKRQYLLVEFPTSSIPAYTERLFYDLQSNGVTPIIVHPERNHIIIEHPNKLKNLIEKGCLTQLTAASFTGGFGKQIQKLSKKLIEANLIHFIASDAHNTTNRSFHMKEAYEKLAKEYGASKRDEFVQTTKDLINGEIITPLEPSKIKKNRLFDLF